MPLAQRAVSSCRGCSVQKSSGSGRPVRGVSPGPAQWLPVWNGRNFRMPDGARIVGQGTETVSMQVSMPLDEHGFIGRQCPSCSQLFRVDADDYEALSDELDLWCVYCGH